jgi:hypothetical protein
MDLFPQGIRSSYHVSPESLRHGYPASLLYLMVDDVVLDFKRYMVYHARQQRHWLIVSVSIQRSANIRYSVHQDCLRQAERHDRYGVYPLGV